MAIQKVLGLQQGRAGGSVLGGSTRPIGPRLPDFHPADIPGLRLWLKPDFGLYQEPGNGSPATADSDPVGAWVSAYGANVIAQQATQSKRLTLNLSVGGRRGLRVDGTDDHLEISNGLVWLPTSRMSISFWTKSNTTGPYAVTPNILGTSSDDNWLNGFGFYYNEGVIAFWMAAWDTNVCIQAATLTNWNHVVGVWDGATLYLYINKVNTVTDTYSGTLVNGAMCLGTSSPDAAAVPMDGYLSQILLYDAVLSQTDVNNLYAYGAP